jgi:hypothetical protein
LRPTFSLYLVAGALLAGCTATSQSPTGSDFTWLVHCETDKSYLPDLAAVPRVDQDLAPWAEHDD